MKQTTIPVKPESKVNVKAAEDLSIEGSQNKFLTAVVRHGDTLKIVEGNGGIEIRATSDCRLLVPDSLLVTIEKVGGDASVKQLSTHLIVGKVGADLTLQSIAGASIETVGGDFMVRDSSGPVEVARVGGDLHGQGVAGLTSLGIGGDVTLLDIRGKCVVGAGGDVDLSTTLTDLPEITAKAGGDLRLEVTPEARANLELHSGADEISVHASGQEVDWEGEELSLPLGDGGAQIRLETGGSIEVTDQHRPDEDIEDDFDNLEETWKDFGIELEDRIRESLELASETLARASQTAGQVSSKARARIDRAMQQVEEKTAKLDQKRRFVGFAIDNAQNPVKPKSGATDEERMLVLRMLQDKKISVEEAEKLLNALDR